MLNLKIKQASKTKSNIFTVIENKTSGYQWGKRERERQDRNWQLRGRNYYV